MFGAAKPVQFFFGEQLKSFEPRVFEIGEQHVKTF